MSSVLLQSISLPCGASINNRLAKAAMTEGLATPRGEANADLERLYGLWSDGGAGVLISGNIALDADHLERPGNVVIDSEPSEAAMAALKRWTAAATRNGNHFWAQLSHAGRQTQKIVNPHPKAPSAVALNLPGGQFGQPVPLSLGEIEQLRERYALAAKVCKEAGFTGVQIHAAHGYLLSQFLSPLSNRRDDRYGGSLENRARLLLEVVAKTREAVGPEFPIIVKLNSADFQRGGFNFEDSLQVAQWLEAAGIDCLEISGGTYEQPKLLGVEGLEEVHQQSIAESTKAREAYFVDFAKAMREKIGIPLMVTGGLRRRDAMEAAIESGSADLIGLGRPMCLDTDAPQALLNGAEELSRYENDLQLLPNALNFLNKIETIKTLATFSVQYWFYAQLDALGKTGKPERGLSVFRGAVRVMSNQFKFMKQRKKALGR